MNTKTDCKYCGESIEIPKDEYIAPDGDYAHFECQMDYEELGNGWKIHSTTYSPVDLF